MTVHNPDRIAVHEKTDTLALQRRLNLLRSNLTDRAQAEVDRLHGEAVGYVWGWQDAGGDDIDSKDSYLFGLLYAVHAAEYASGTPGVGFRNNVKTAYRLYMAGKDISGR